MAVEYLLNRCYNIKRDEKVLFLGSGGGVGTLAGQWGKSKGAFMIGVDGGEEKCDLARQSGYAEVIDFTKEDVVARVKGDSRMAKECLLSTINWWPYLNKPSTAWDHVVISFLSVRPARSQCQRVDPPILQSL